MRFGRGQAGAKRSSSEKQKRKNTLMRETWLQFSFLILFLLKQEKFKSKLFLFFPFLIKEFIKKKQKIQK